MRCHTFLLTPAQHRPVAPIQLQVKEVKKVLLAHQAENSSSTSKPLQPFRHPLPSFTSVVFTTMAWVAGILGGLFGEEVIAGGMLTELFGDFSLVTEGGLEEALFGEAGGGLPMILEEEVVPEVVEAVPEIAGGGMVPEIAGGGVVPEVAGEGMLPEGTVEATGEGVMPIEMPETARTAKEWFMDVTPSFVTQTDPRWIPAVVAPPAIAGGIVGGVGSNAGLKRSWMLSRAVTRLATSAGGLTAGMGLHGHEGVERSLTLPGMVVQLDASNDIHRLPHFNGLEVNMVDMPAGTAMFSSAGDELHKGFEPVKGLINGADVGFSSDRVGMLRC